MTATIITPDLLRSESFLWDTSRQTPPSARYVTLDARDAALHGKILLAAAAASRCGAQIQLIAAEDAISPLSLAIPESSFVADGESGGVQILYETPTATPSHPAVVASNPNGDLPENCIGIIGAEWENVAARKSTFLGGWPQLKVLLADGTTYEPEPNPSRETPPLYVAGGEAVLAGICGAMLARGLSLTSAAVWSLHLWHLAIEAATEELGSDTARASDLIARLPGSLRYATRKAEAHQATRPGLRPS